MSKLPWKYKGPKVFIWSLEGTIRDSQHCDVYRETRNLKLQFWVSEEYLQICKYLMWEWKFFPRIGESPKWLINSLTKIGSLTDCWRRIIKGWKLGTLIIPGKLGHDKFWIKHRIRSLTNLDSDTCYLCDLDKSLILNFHFLLYQMQILITEFLGKWRRD
jgi:hypothetical protein